MIEQEIKRLENRIQELEEKILPQLEHRTEFLYAQIVPLHEGSDEREKLEQEFKVLSKELRLRSDEKVNSRQEVARLRKDLESRTMIRRRY